MFLKDAAPVCECCRKQVECERVLGQMASPQGLSAPARRNEEATVPALMLLEQLARCEGLFALLLIVLEWTRPGLPSPLRPICDLRVLNHFIKEARDAEVAMRSCRDGCSLSESVTVPQTRVDFDVWEKKSALDQAQEVQSGLWLLHQALSLLRASVTNTALHSHIDNGIRNLLSINAVLRSLNIQEYTPSSSAVGGEETWRVSSAPDLLQVHVNFLRGKVRLLLLDAQACHQDVS